jgi:hypothetical protein
LTTIVVFEVMGSDVFFLILIFLLHFLLPYIVTEVVCFGIAYARAINGVYCLLCWKESDMEGTNGGKKCLSTSRQFYLFLSHSDGSGR